MTGSRSDLRTLEMRAPDRLSRPHMARSSRLKGVFNLAYINKRQASKLKLPFLLPYPVRPRASDSHIDIGLRLTFCVL